MTHAYRPATWLLCLALGGLLLGCKPKPTPGTSPNPTGFTQSQAGPQGSGPPAAAPVDRGPFTGGKKVFAETGCSRCHTVDGVRLVSSEGPPPGQPGAFAGAGRPPGGPGGPPGPGGPGGPGGRMGPRAPDLGHVAKEADHTADWFMKYVRDPKAVNPKARMPAFGEPKLNDENLRALAQYLTTLK